MDPRSYYEHNARVYGHYQASKASIRNNFGSNCCRDMCDSDSSCDEMVCAPDCPQGIHCMKPLCVYRHPYGRSHHPIPTYQSMPYPRPVFPTQPPSNYPYVPPPTPYNCYSYPPPPPNSTWHPSSTYTNPSGTWTTTQPHSQPQYPPAVHQPPSSSSPNMPYPPPPQPINMTMPVPRPSKNVDKLAMDQPKFVKMPEAPKSTGIQTVNRQSAASGSLGFMINSSSGSATNTQSQTTAPYPVDGPINMPQPRMVPVNNHQNSNHTIVHRIENMKIGSNSVPVKPDVINPKTIQPLVQPQLRPSSSLPPRISPSIQSVPKDSNTLQPTNNNPPIAARKQYNSLDENVCCVCWENKPEIVLIPCGHAKFCQGCTEQFNECPMCRSKITMKQRIFL